MQCPALLELGFFVLRVGVVLNLGSIRRVLGASGLQLLHGGFELGGVRAKGMQQGQSHFAGVLAISLRLVIGPGIVRFGSMNDGLSMRSMRGNGDDGQENADDPHHNSDAAGHGIGGMFRFDFDFRHGQKYPQRSTKCFPAKASTAGGGASAALGRRGERVHLTTCRRGLARAIPRTPLRTTSTISPKAPTFAMNSPISVSVLVSSTMSLAGLGDSTLPPTRRSRAPTASTCLGKICSLINSSSRARASPPVMSSTATTSTSFRSCALICAIT